MKFALTVTLLAAVFASAIAAPNPDFFSNIAANAQKIQSNVANAFQNWQENLAALVQQKQAEFAEAENNFGAITENLQAALHSKWEELTVKGEEFAQKALSAVEQTKEKIQAGVQAKRADAIAFAKNLAVQSKDILAHAEKVKEQVAVNLEESLENLASQAQQYVANVGSQWAEGENVLQSFIANAQEKLAAAKEEAAEKVKEAQAYAQTMKDQAESAVIQHFGTSDYNQVIAKLASSAQENLQQYKAKLEEILAQGTEKAQSLMNDLDSSEGNLFEQVKAAFQQFVKGQKSE